MITSRAWHHAPIATRCVAVHMANLAPAVIEKPQRWTLKIAVVFVPAAGALLALIEYLRLWMS